MLGFGIEFCEQAKENAKTEDEKAFNSLIKFIFEAAQDSISNSRNLSITHIKSKKIKKNFYNIFANTNEKINNQYGNNYYLPLHSVVKRFKKLFRELLEAEGYHELVQNFIFDFSMRIEEKADHNNNHVLKQRSYIKNKKQLTEHLQHTYAMIYECNPADKKYLAEYYVENNAVVTDINETWDKKDEYFSEYVNQDSEGLGAINVVLKSIYKIDKHHHHDKNNRYTIVAAPFGIGKTSLAVYIASTLASKYLDTMGLINNNNGDIDDTDTDIHGNSCDNSSVDYIPVFIALKDVSESGRHIERKLQSIFLGQQQAKRKNILLICDGLDEYNFEKTKLKRILNNLSKKYNYPNIHFLITTRLDTEIQQIYPHLKNYIRLLPFNVTC